MLELLSRPDQQNRRIGTTQTEMGGEEVTQNMAGNRTAAKKASQTAKDKTMQYGLPTRYYKKWCTLCICQIVHMPL